MPKKSIKKLAEGGKPEFIIKSRMRFFKIDVGFKDSLIFFRDLLIYLGFTVHHEDEEMISLDNGDNEILIHHAIKLVGGPANFLNIGINTLNFEVDDKQTVCDFRDGFLIPRNIKFVTNESKHRGEENYAVFFDTREHIKIGVASALYGTFWYPAESSAEKMKRLMTRFEKLPKN